MKKYTIESTSDEGIYFLVNGWNKRKTFWYSLDVCAGHWGYVKQYFFNKPGQAKASLTKLLKIMDDYKTDTFRLIEIDENNRITYLQP